MVKEDSVWALMIEEARNLVDAEPDMMSFMQRSILDHTCFDSALSKICPSLVTSLLSKMLWKLIL